ncbi:hypothetical protein BST61_g6768 [Cercospora zeina]
MCVSYLFDGVPAHSAAAVFTKQEPAALCEHNSSQYRQTNPQVSQDLGFHKTRRMAVPRDPAFWKRFSVAVHRDEEAQTVATAQDPASKQQAQSTWLARQKRKSSRRTWFCFGFWLMFAVLVAVVVVAVIWPTKTRKEEVD